MAFQREKGNAGRRSWTFVWQDSLPPLGRSPTCLRRWGHVGESYTPGRLTAGTWEYTPWRRQIIWTKPSFSGSMLNVWIFQGVGVGFYPEYILTPQKFWLFWEPKHPCDKTGSGPLPLQGPSWSLGYNPYHPWDERYVYQTWMVDCYGTCGYINIFMYHTWMVWA